MMQSYFGITSQNETAQGIFSVDFIDLQHIRKTRKGG